jgi:hypothetical protein
MASGAQTTAGSTIALSASLPTTYDDNITTGFPSLTYTLVGDVTEIGEVGKEYNLVTHNPIGDRKTYKFKGNYNNGSQSLSMASVPTDAGQIILLAAVSSDTSISAVVTDQAGNKQYYTGTPLSFKESFAAESIQMASCTFELDSDIVKVAAP